MLVAKAGGKHELIENTDPLNSDRVSTRFQNEKYMPSLPYGAMGHTVTIQTDVNFNL